jgi:mannosyl-oligosaccharide alpha-1,2-mannosidase
MYERFIPVAIKKLLFRPLTPANRTILLPGALTISSPTDEIFTPHCQHLACFTGGMVALASKIFNRPDDMEVAKQLVDGCVWAYESMPSGVMPETFRAVVSKEGKGWDEREWLAAVEAKVLEEEEEEWAAGDNAGLSISERARKRIEQHRLVPGISDISDRRYALRCLPLKDPKRNTIANHAPRRPEAIESLFILYRLTGHPSLPTTAWTLFQSITKHTRTAYAHAALSDVTVPEPPQEDIMESFWTAETLKYFFLIFSEPDVVKLDEWILSTEAHVFRLTG